MCLAGEGGGNGRLKNRRGVDLAGDGDTPAGSGLPVTVPVGYGLGHVAFDDWCWYWCVGVAGAVPVLW